MENDGRYLIVFLKIDPDTVTYTNITAFVSSRRTTRVTFLGLQIYLVNVLYKSTSNNQFGNLINSSCVKFLNLLGWSGNNNADDTRPKTNVMPI